MAAAGPVAGALLAGTSRHGHALSQFAGSAWLVPWAVVVAFFGLADIAERVVPTLPARLAGAGTTALLAATCASTGNWGEMARGVGCALVAWAVFATWSAVRPVSLGFGDARMACLVALGGGAVWPAGLFASLAGSVFVAGVAGKLLRAGEDGVALAPFLAASGIAVAVAGAG